MVWYARFNGPYGNLAATKSTGVPVVGKKGRKQEAYNKANQMLETLQYQNSPVYLTYLESFWKEDSKYAKTKRIAEKKPLSKDYIKLNAAGIKKHVMPFPGFKKINLADLKPGMIEDWKLWALERGVGPRRINAILQSMAVPVRYALSRGEIPSDPFRTVKNVSYTTKEKGILSRKEVGSLLSVKDDDPRVTLVVLLAVLTGIRRGEARGLRWKDIDRTEGIIHIQNNYVDSEGSKSCKWGSARDVLLPTAAKEALEEVHAKSPYTLPDDFVLFSLFSRKEPISGDTIRRGFFRMLKHAGIPREEQKKRNLTYHGMRHTFVTLARMAGLPDITVQALAGHKSAEMMNHYSHAAQVIDFSEARKKLEGIEYPEADTKEAKG
jgi:integrase